MKSTTDVIRGLREDKDLKQSDIASILNISQQQYSRYETDASEIPLRALSALADYYGVSADYLMGRTDCREGVAGLNKNVTAEHTIGAVISDILSLSVAGRASVIEYIDMRKMKECCAKRHQPLENKEKDGRRS